MTNDFVDNIQNKANIIQSKADKRFKIIESKIKNADDLSGQKL